MLCPSALGFVNNCLCCGAVNQNVRTNTVNMKTRPIMSSIRRLPSVFTVALLLAGAALPALAQRPLGIDVSSYQGGGINWTSVKGAGIQFAWAKATESTTITDPDFAVNENNGKAAGVYMGAYHFAHPNLNTPGAEAGHFWSVAGGYIKADGKSQHLLGLGQRLVRRHRGRRRIDALETGPLHQRLRRVQLRRQRRAMDVRRRRLQR
jgi:hypothetical protein